MTRRVIAAQFPDDMTLEDIVKLLNSVGAVEVREYPPQGAIR